MILGIAKELLRVGHTLRLIKKSGRISTHWGNCCSSSMSLEQEGAHIFTGNCFVWVQLLRQLNGFELCCWQVHWPVCFCSFLKKLYPSSLECPRSYDKLRFDPRCYLNSFYHASSRTWFSFFNDCFLQLLSTICIFHCIFSSCKIIVLVVGRIQLGALLVSSPIWHSRGLVACEAGAFWQ